MNCCWHYYTISRPLDVASFFNSIPILSEGHICVPRVCLWMCMYLCEWFRMLWCVCVFLCVLLPDDGAYVIAHMLMYASYLLANNTPT